MEGVPESGQDPVLVPGGPHLHQVIGVGRSLVRAALTTFN